LGAVAGLLIAVAPAMYLLHAMDVPRRIIIGFGVLCWVAGVLVKWVVYQLVIVKYLHARWPAAGLAITQGMLSATTELGAAVGFFLMLPHLTLVQAVGIGAGAAFVEGILAATVRPSHGTPYGEHVSEQVKTSSVSTLVFLNISDRLVATVVQVCSRTLVFLSVQSGNPLPGLLAFATFAAIDGYAYYALIQQWKFSRIATAARLYGVLAGFATIQALTLFAFI
jgi:hypothetical protein